MLMVKEMMVRAVMRSGVKYQMESKSYSFTVSHLHGLNIEALHGTSTVRLLDCAPRYTVCLCNKKMLQQQYHELSLKNKIKSNKSNKNPLFAGLSPNRPNNPYNNNASTE